MKKITSIILFLICDFAMAAQTKNLATNTKTIGSETLILNGRGIHRRYSFRVYELSLFLKNKTKGAEKILNSKDTKFVKMKFLRNLKAKQIRDGFNDAFKINCANQCAKLKPYLDTLQKSVPDMKTGKSFEFTFSPEKVFLKVQGQGEIEIPSSEFAKVLLLTWIGPHPPSKDLKSGVLGLL